jgi:trk system potassium uptake protein TrkH
MKTEFTMPREFKIHDFLKSVIVFTLLMETIGAILFFVAFKMENVETGFAIWSSIFHSVSAFCTAGFGLYNNSFESFATHDFINWIIIILSISGALGFIVVTDIWNYFRKKTKAISFTSKMISGGFFTLLFIATAIIYIYEPLLKSFSFGERLQMAFFQAMTSITTVGFNTVVVGNLSLPILLVTFFLMYIGASPSSTAGGMKITTLTALISVIKSKLQNNSKVTFLNRVIPKDRIDIAISTFIFYTSILFLSTFLLTFSENFTFEKILFETLSAMGTVGLSMGITGNLSDFGKIVIICIMFIGRLGVLTFGLALLAKKQQKAHKNEEDLAV